MSIDNKHSSDFIHRSVVCGNCELIRSILISYKRSQKSNSARLRDLSPEELKNTLSLLDPSHQLMGTGPGVSPIKLWDPGNPFRHTPKSLKWEKEQSVGSRLQRGTVGDPKWIHITKGKNVSRGNPSPVIELKHGGKGCWPGHRRTRVLIQPLQWQNWLCRQKRGKTCNTLGPELLSRGRGGLIFSSKKFPHSNKPVGILRNS